MGPASTRSSSDICAGSSCSFAAGTTIGAPDSTSPYSVTWSTQPADGTYTIVARATDNVGNTTDSAERTVTVDNTGPSSVLSVNEGTRPDLQYFDSATDTYYYNPAATGDFSVHDVAGDPAGVASVDFPAIADTGFSGSAKNDTSSPYDSNSYTFTTASASAPGSQTVVATDALGNASNDSFDIVRDVTAPSSGSVSYTDGYDADGTVVVTTANGSDSGAGVDASSGVLERRTSTFSAGSCAGFSGGWSPVTSPDTVASGLCAQYRYRVSDRVGNEALYTSTDVVRVDTSAPGAPAVTLSESSSWAFVSGTTIYLNTGQTGSYDVSATTSDAQSGIDKVSFPAGQDDSTSPYEATYAFGDLSGLQTVTAHSGAGLTASSSFTVTADTAAPTGGSVTYADGYDADGQVTISTANGNDPLSGVDASSGVLESRTSALTERLLRRLLRRLDDRHEPRHRRHRNLRAVPLPRLRQRRQRGDLHLHERRQGRHERPGRSGHHALRVEPLCLRLRADGLRQHRPERKLRRRRDELGCPVGDREDPLPRPGGRHLEPVRDELRLRRPLRLADGHGVQRRRADRLRHVHGHARHDGAGDER